MTRKLLADLLIEEWIEDASKVTGRVRDVYRPHITVEKGQKGYNLQSGPLCEVKDGGVTDKDAAGLGWQEEKKTSRATITLQCLDSHGGESYMNGYRAGANGDSDAGLDPYEKENYGGLTGEVERILDQNRKGLAEYQLVEAFEINDLSEQLEYGRWRVDIEVRLHSGATVVG